MVAVVGEQGEVLCRSSPFGEDAPGYAHLFELLGPPEDCLLALEATGHYWRNLFVALLAKGYAVAVLNPLRTRRFAEEELQRTKTDAIDALGIARFAAQKRPPAAQLPDVATEELRELSRLRDRLQEDFASRLRRYIERLTWASQSSPGMCARSRASLPPPFCRATQLRRLFVALR
jgi:transposase